MQTDFVDAGGQSTRRETKEPSENPIGCSYDTPQKNGWLLLTFDDDFLSLVEGEGLEHRGLIYVQQAGRQIGDVVKAVDEHLQNRSEDDASIQYL